MMVEVGLDVPDAADVDALVGFEFGVVRLEVVVVGVGVTIGADVVEALAGCDMDGVVVVASGGARDVATGGGTVDVVVDELGVEVTAMLVVVGGVRDTTAVGVLDVSVVCEVEVTVAVPGTVVDGTDVDIVGASVVVVVVVVGASVVVVVGASVVVVVGASVGIGVGATVVVGTGVGAAVVGSVGIESA